MSRIRSLTNRLLGKQAPVQADEVDTMNENQHPTDVSPDRELALVREELAAAEAAEKETAARARALDSELAAASARKDDAGREYTQDPSAEAGERYRRAGDEVDLLSLRHRDASERLAEAMQRRQGLAAREARIVGDCERAARLAELRERASLGRLRAQGEAHAAAILDAERAIREASNALDALVDDANAASAELRELGEDAANLASFHRTIALLDGPAVVQLFRDVGPGLRVAGLDGAPRVAEVLLSGFAKVRHPNGLPRDPSHVPTRRDRALLEVVQSARTAHEAYEAVRAQQAAWRRDDEAARNADPETVEQRDRHLREQKRLAGRDPWGRAAQDPPREELGAAQPDAPAVPDHACDAP